MTVMTRGGFEVLSSAPLWVLCRDVPLGVEDLDGFFDSPYGAGGFAEFDGYDGGLWLVSSGQEYDLLEEAGLGDDVGEVGACFGDGDLRWWLFHAAMLQQRPKEQGAVLYNSPR